MVALAVIPLAWSAPAVAQCAARLGGPVYFLDDDAALLVRDPASAPEVISTGQLRYFAERVDCSSRARRSGPTRDRPLG